MIKINFSQEEIEALHYERYHHPHPKVQKKMEVLYLKSQGVAHKDICQLCQMSKTTFVSYLKQYQKGGVERLKKLGYKGQPSELRKHATTLEEYFKKHPPKTTAEAQAIIEELTGIKRSLTQVCVIRCKVATESDSKWPPIPIQSGHFGRHFGLCVIRCKVATDSDEYGH